MSSPIDVIRQYDSQFDLWWKEVKKVGRFDAFTLPSDKRFAKHDPDGAFDSGMSAEQFVKSLK